MTTQETNPSVGTPAISRRDCLSTLLFASAGLAVSAYAGPARAQAANWEHIIKLAGQQRMLTQRLSKETVLVALRHNVRENVRNLEINSERFARILTGLHWGDPNLVLPPTTDLTILENIWRVEELWPVFEDAVTAVAVSGTVTPRQLHVVADTNLPLLRAMDDTVHAYEAVAHAGNAVSMLAVAANLAGAQSMLCQKMSKEVYLIAIGHDVGANRQELLQSIERFDQVLKGLVFGDSELLLLPAPTAQIKSQLEIAQRLWSEFRPMASAAAAGAPTDEDMIAETASLNLALLNEMTSVVDQYVALRQRRRTPIGPASQDDQPTS